MKNIIKLGVLALMTIFAMTACSPQDGDNHSLGNMPEESQLAFTATPTASKANVIDLKNESAINGVATWDFGTGVSANGNTAKAEYPFAGEYTIAMTLYTSGGSATISKNITIAADDMSLLDTPMYNALTGGADNLTGKTWVFDQYHDGHFGVGPDKNDEGKMSPSWWSCPAEGKEGSSLYTQQFTFTQIGVKMEWKNNGSIYTNESGTLALAGLGYPNSVVPAAGDYDVEYAPKSTGYTFTLNEADKTLSLSDGAFFGHYAGTSNYQILELTANVLYIRCASTLESGNYWYYRFVPINNANQELKELSEVRGAMR